MCIRDSVRADRDPQVAGEAEFGPRPDEKPPPHEPFVPCDVVASRCRQDEVGMRPPRRDTEVGDSRRETLPRTDDLAATRLDRVGIRKTGPAGGKREAVHVERLVHGVVARKQVWMDDCKAETEPGDPEQLRERAQDHDRASGGDVCHTADKMCIRDSAERGLRMRSAVPGSPSVLLEHVL